MPEQPDDFEPTEVDIDVVTEEATGKPIIPENLAAGITSMRQRIAQLEMLKIQLLDQPGDTAGSRDADLSRSLAALNSDLAVARERLAHYVAQIGQQN